MTPPGSVAQTNSYDANGSETGRNSDSFTWNAANRLTAATVGGQAASFAYNGTDLRTSRTIGGTTTNFVWDLTKALRAVLDDGTQYVYGSGLVSQVTSSGTFYPLADGLGSTVAVVDGSGSTVKTYAYDAFGAVKSSTGTQNTDYQFAGQDTDSTGLQYLRDRYYDPTTGRFLARDRWAGSVGDPALNHPYSYAHANPASFTDPSGEDCGNPFSNQNCGNWPPPQGCCPPPAPPGAAPAGSSPPEASSASDPGDEPSPGDTPPIRNPSEDVIVLGHFPAYVNLAQDIGARYFQIPPDVWETMSPDEQWALNQAFLDDAIANDSEIDLATPPDQARSGSFYEKEIQYLESKGYTPSADGTKMIPPPPPQFDP